MSFLEMLDALNEQLIAAAEEPIAFDHDCREGICGRKHEMTDISVKKVNAATAPTGAMGQKYLASGVHRVLLFMAVGE